MNVDPKGEGGSRNVSGEPTRKNSDGPQDLDLDLKL